MRKFSEIKETYIREEPGRETPPMSERIIQLEEFAHNKDKRSEVIKAWTEISDHPEAEDMNSPVGSAFDRGDLDEELKAAFDVIKDGGFVYASFEQSLWIRHRGQLIRVM